MPKRFMQQCDSDVLSMAECLNGEIFYSLKEARIVIEQWRRQYNRVRPHAALGYRPPAPGAYTPPGNPVPRSHIIM